jgi:predicted RNA-binding Zn ribbon-like protein
LSISPYAHGVSSETAAGARPDVPPTAAAIIALLNSRTHTIHPEALDSPRTAAPVLHLLGHTGIDASELQLAELRALRSELMAVLTAEHDGADPAPFWAEFTARTSGVTFRQDFSAPARVDLRQVTGDPIVGLVARLTADMIGSGRWSRLRVCANDDCRSVFYDTTRSRTQRWHSYEICGNKRNVAAHRSRTRGPATDEHA